MREPARRDHIKRGDLAGAESEFREAIRLDPWAASFHHELGRVLFTLGDTVAAEQEFGEAVRLDSTNAGARYDLGKLLERNGDRVAAEREFREVIRLEPNCILPYYHLANDGHKQRQTSGSF